MRYFLALVDLEYKVVCVISDDTNVFTIMLDNCKKLNGLTLLFVWSKEKQINVNKVYVQLGAEKAKALIGFYCFSGCDTAPEDTEAKSFLNSELGVFKVF